MGRIPRKTTVAENKKAVLFARVSTARQKKEGLSIPEIQIPRIRTYAKEHDLEVVAEFTAGESGGSDKERKTFNEMVEYVEKHKDVKNIVVYRVDRATRNFKDAVRINDLCNNYDIKLHCVDDNLILDKDTCGSKKTEWDAKIFVGQSYLNRVKEDGINTKYTKLEHGELPWHAPYGYQNVKNGRESTVIPKEPEATIVREVCRRYSTNTYSCVSLAKEISAEYDEKFDKNKIHRILTNKFNVGVIVDRKTGEEYPHNYEHLISQEVFDINQDILSGRNLNSKHYMSKVGALYTGLIHCTMDGCDCTLSYDPKTKKQKNGNVRHYHYYHCSGGSAVHGEKKVHNITEEKIDEAIANTLTHLKPLPERMKELRKELSEMHEKKNVIYDKKRGELEARQKQLRDFKRRSYDMLMAESITQEDYNENVARYDSELAEITNRLNELDSADRNYYITVGYLLDLVEHAGDLYKVATADEKRQIVSVVFSNLEWDGKTLNLPLKKPFDMIMNTSNVLCGWRDGIRTRNHSVNSRALYH